MIRFTQGDMFETPADIRVNTVNCVGVMGAGVALAFKNRYPAMFREYKRECEAGNIRPGAIHVWREFGNWVINFPTKRHWRDDSRYEDIESGLVALREYLLKAGPVRVALPALGCGHGGLDWEKVSGMIRQHMDGLEAEIIVFDPADSHTIARKGQAATPSRPLRAGDTRFPDRLVRVQIREIAYTGGISANWWECDVAVFLSAKPDEKEYQAAMDCVADLSGPGIRIGLVLGSALSNKLACLVLEHGGSVIGWVAEGLDRYKVPKILAPAADVDRLRIVSIAKSHQAWNPGLAARSAVAALALSRAALFLDPAPKWLGQLASGDFAEDLSRLFHIRYRDASPEITLRWQELQARAIGRRAADNRPNLDPIREAIGIANAREDATIPPEPVLIREQPAPYQASPSSMSTPYPKRLIEVDLPIRRISAHARREKSIRHGHISTLHIWWARRPLAACRAVICAALWPDPADGNCPPAFIEEAKRQMLAWTPHERLQLLSAESRERFNAARQKKALFNDPVELRKALLDFIADFANWDNSTKPEFLETSRSLTQSAHEALGGVPGTRPLVVDPFAGGGSIPLEALRVGADAFASDLNPIPVLLNKVVLEYIPKYGQRLADEVRKWGAWIKQEAEKELAEFYPKDPDGATPIAYLWARTIQCEGPGCGAEVPLIRSLWLAKKANRSVALQLVPNPKEKRVDFKIIRWQQPERKSEKGGWVNQDAPEETIEKSNFEGTVKRGSATCPCCGYTTPVSRVRTQLKDQNGGGNNATLLSVVTTKKGQQGRTYRLPSKLDKNAVIAASLELQKRIAQEERGLSLLPNEPTPIGGGSGAGRAFNQQAYGMEKFFQLFTDRQLLSLTTLVRFVEKAGNEIRREMNDQSYGDAVQGLLALLPGKQADLGNSLCRWEPVAQCPRQLFGRQAISIVWDFAEGVPIGESSGAWEVIVRNSVNTLENSGHDWNIGTIQQADAAYHPLPSDIASLMFTDPPYYDAVPYSDLSDFFFVWLKRALPGFSNGREVTPKEEECILDEIKGKDDVYFVKTMERALAEGRRFVSHDGVGVVVFAHKSTGGWEAQLEAMLSAGWTITASWPVDTECGSRLRAMDSAALASSVHLVCRPREHSDGSVRADDIGDWRDVLAELPKRIHEWMPRLAEEGVVGADAIFACLGPALEIFSRYARVEKASGEQVTLREYLEHVWAAVSREALSTILSDADVSGLEPDARLTAMWLWTLTGGVSGGDDSESGDDEEDDDESPKKKPAKGGYTLEYDAARKIAQGLGADLASLRGVVEVQGETARLLPVAERTTYLFGKEAKVAEAPKRKKKDQQLDLFSRLTDEATAESAWEEVSVSKPGETVLDRIHQSMILFATGRGEALRRFLVEDGAGRDAAFWKLAQSLSALYPGGSQEKRWVDGVLARKKGLGL